MAYEAKVISDSICNGQRLTTMQVTHPLIVHAEFMTHCAFARNASSSRAIPFKKMVQRALDDPFIPAYWGINQSGMQSAAELPDNKRIIAIRKWLEARDHAVKIATQLADSICATCDSTGNFYRYDEDGDYLSCDDCGGDGVGLNVHKQIVNRLLSPFGWITVCVTGDWPAWSNYFALRCHPDAQPDIQQQAYMAQYEYFHSKPVELAVGEWHTPYFHAEEHALIKFDKDVAIKISTGRCARTSYLTQEGIRDFSKDIELHDRLKNHTPLHASPFEHVCQAKGDGQRYAKYIGWKSYRHMLNREYVVDFIPNHPKLIQEAGENQVLTSHEHSITSIQ